MANEFLSSVRRGFLSNIERMSILSYLEKNKRLDGRSLLEMRELRLVPNYIEKAEGSCFVSLGKTKIIAGIKVSIGSPYPDTPNQGAFIVNMETMPIASPSFELGPPSEPGIETARVVDRGIRSAEFIDLESLCIEPGKSVYLLFIDLYPIDDNGNLVDAAFYSAIGALLTARLPKVEIEEEKPVLIRDETVPLKVRMENLPIQLTYGKILNKIILDPTNQEELLIDYKITMAIARGNIVGIQKSGKGAADIDDIIFVANDLKSRAEKIRQNILAQIKK